MNLLMDFMILNIFLGLGWDVREKFTVLQRIFMPSSVVGGIMLLICGPQVLNIVPISPMIGKYPNFLIDIILTCLVFGTRLASTARGHVHTWATLSEPPEHTARRCSSAWG